jgi:hypothetical protein
MDAWPLALQPAIAPPANVKTIQPYQVKRNLR